MPVIGLVGTGPVGLGFLKGLTQKLEHKNEFSEIHLFDIWPILGAGTPYNPSVTEPLHLLNGRIGHLPPDFSKWLDENAGDIPNREKVKLAFKKIFEERLKAKFHKRFGVEYDEEKKSEYQDSKKELCDHYDRLWQYYQRHYLNIDPSELAKYKDFYPRMLFGMYSIAHFEAALATLEAAGVKIIRHPSTEVTGLRKQEDGKLVLVFGDKELVVDKAVVASGAWPAIPPKQSDIYFNNLWPVSDLKKNVETALTQEIERRKTENNPNKTLLIAIEGKGLSAVDAVKTLLSDGEITADEKGDLTYLPQDFEGYKIKIVMTSRTALMHKVMDSEAFWSKWRGKYPAGMIIDDQSLKTLAEKQQQKVNLWQVVIMLCRSVEIAYKTLGEEAKALGNIDDVKMAELRINQIRNFLYVMLNDVKKDASGNEMLDRKEENKKFFDELSGDSLEQLEAIKERFNLTNDAKANYANILEAINSAAGFTDIDPWQRLESDLREAEKGDVAGMQVWKGLMFGAIKANLYNYLSREEASFYSQATSRMMEVLAGMPPQSARELLAFHKAGSLDMTVLGKDYTKSFVSTGGKEITTQERDLAENKEEISDRKIIFKTANNSLECDVVINATGFNFSLLNNPPALYKSMHEQGIAITPPKQLWYENDAKYEEAKSNMIDAFGAEKTASILKQLTRDADGKWYSTPKNMMIVDNMTVDAQKNPTAPNLLIPRTFGGVYGGIKSGEQAALQLLKNNVPAPTPVSVAVGTTLANSESTKTSSMSMQ